MANRSYFKKGTISFRAIAIAVAICLASVGIFSGSRRTNKQEAIAYSLPSPTQILPLSKWHSYPVLKGIRIDPEDPLNLEFIIDTASQEDVNKEEASRLIRYFLAGLTLPDEELWVNLSPYEEERVVSDALALTDLGKDMLSQDYVLKQLLSSLTYPEDELGKEYWKEVYREVARIAGTTNAPREKPSRLIRVRSAQGCRCAHAKAAFTWPGILRSRWRMSGIAGRSAQPLGMRNGVGQSYATRTLSPGFRI